MHYLDNYFTVGSLQSAICADSIQTIMQVTPRLGIPLAPDKLEGPTTCLVFLGISINTTCMETVLPDHEELLPALQLCSSCKKCHKHELVSLIGKLNFTCRIMPDGRIFLCCLIEYFSGFTSYISENNFIVAILSRLNKCLVDFEKTLTPFFIPLPTSKISVSPAVGFYSSTCTISHDLIYIANCKIPQLYASTALQTTLLGLHVFSHDLIYVINCIFYDTTFYS